MWKSVFFFVFLNNRQTFFVISIHPQLFNLITTTLVLTHTHTHFRISIRFQFNFRHNTNIYRTQALIKSNNLTLNRFSLHKYFSTTNIYIHTHVHLYTYTLLLLLLRSLTLSPCRNFCNSIIYHQQSLSLPCSLGVCEISQFLLIVFIVAGLSFYGF